ncbi:MAG: DUF192 domain-containing protein [Lysobacterales bacterium]|jgi:hypothetical protein
MRFVLCAALALVCTACAAGEPSVELKGKRFSVEVADTREKQALGLMFRESMPPDHGMLFIFPSAAPRAFWMKNTRIPLDIMYFNADLELVSMSQNTPPCRTRRCPSYPSASPAMYVLELNGGTASELGVEVGDRLMLELD